MQTQLVALVSEPWIVTVLALAAVAGDALLPFLPSGSLVIAAALFSLDHGGAPVVLVVSVAAASFLGDLVVVTLAGDGTSRADALFARHSRLASAAGRMRGHLAGRLPSVTVAGRFVPAGRTVLGLTLGAQPGQRARYLRWSALGGLLWACYLVGLSAVNDMWFETRWIGFAVSTASAVVLSTCLARSLHRRAGAEGPPAMSSRGGHPQDSPDEVRAVSAGGAPHVAAAGARRSARTEAPCTAARVCHGASSGLTAGTCGTTYSLPSASPDGITEASSDCTAAMRRSVLADARRRTPGVGDGLPSGRHSHGRCRSGRRRKTRRSVSRAGP